MTAAATDRATSSPTSRPAPTTKGPTVLRVVASEWSKLVSLRSTAWTAAVTVGLTWVTAYLSANASSGDPGFEPLSSLSQGLVLSQLSMLVLGVLAGTGDFRAGGFRTTFTAVPRRLPVLMAKVLVTTLVGGVVAVVSLAALVLGVLPAARSRDIPLDLTAQWTPQVLLGSGLLLLGMALLGLAVGSLVRRTVLAVTAALALVFVLPVGFVLAADLASPPQVGVSTETVVTELDPVSTVMELMPSNAAYRMTTTPDSAGPDGAPDLGPVGGGLVFAAWILLPLVAAGIRLRTRDLT